MRSSFLAFLSALAAASHVTAAVVERQIVVSAPTTLHAIAAGVDLGALQVDGLIVTVSNSSTGSLFSVSPLEGELTVETLADSDISPSPHAFIEFTGTTAAVCGSTGPLVFVFALASSDPCAVSTGFKFVGNTLEAGVVGTFQVCDGEQIYFEELVTPLPTPVLPRASACTNVELVKPSGVATPLSS